MTEEQADKLIGVLQNIEDSLSLIANALMDEGGRSKLDRIADSIGASANGVVSAIENT